MYLAVASISASLYALAWRPMIVDARLPLLKFFKREAISSALKLSRLGIVPAPCPLDPWQFKQLTAISRTASSASGLVKGSAGFVATGCVAAVDGGTVNVD